MSSPIEEIKNRLDILTVVSNYVKLTKTGVNHRGICPFHNEKGPSFFVNSSRQMFKCFGCGKGGDIFAFIQAIEGVEFQDALKLLAEKAGVKLTKENQQVRTERQRLYEICDVACSFFQKQLQASVWGKKAKEYLEGRGITQESITTWRLGYAPDLWQGLSDFLVGKGYKREEILKAGLLVQSDKGKNPYDRFRGRITFPVFDVNEKVVGFGGRVFKDEDKKETAKYINTPQTLLYDKSGSLYGMHLAKIATRKKNQCILTEGYTDVIMCYQAGFTNTVGVSGTALTQRHLSLLKRYTENLLLAFDMDRAGSAATNRGIQMATAQGFNISVVEQYHQAKDPAEIIAEDPEQWKQMVDKSRSIMEYYFDTAFSKHDKQSPAGKRDIAGMILPVIKSIVSKIEQSHWIAHLAEKLGVSEQVVMEDLKNVKLEPTYESSVEYDSALLKDNKEASVSLSRRKLLEEKIVSMLLREPALVKLISESQHELFSPKMKNAIQYIKQHGEELKVVLADTKSSKEYAFLNDIAWKSEFDMEEEGKSEINLCLMHLQDIVRREKRQHIYNQIKEAEAARDIDRVGALMKEFHIIN